jgi:hypothetical protein
MEQNEPMTEYFNFELTSSGMSISSSTTKDFYLFLSNLDRNSINKEERAQLLKLKIAISLLLEDSLLPEEINISKIKTAKKFA